jgi:hypothetical protein
MNPALVILLIGSLRFNFLNDSHNNPNIVATPVASRAIFSDHTLPPIRNMALQRTARFLFVIFDTQVLK